MEIEDRGSGIAELVEQCSRNNPKAQMQLYRMFSYSMFNISFRIVRDRLLAEDVMQESFLTAFERIKECRTPGSFGSWIKRIVINRSIDELRKKKINLGYLDESLPVPDETVEYNPEDESDQAKLLEQVKKAMGMLPDGYRIVLILRLLENYEYSEIAKELGLAESSVRSQYVRGRQKLLEIVETLKKQK